VSVEPPERVECADGTHLRWVDERDAEVVAQAVGASLDHLRPWMPWADSRSADAAFQRQRLRTLPSMRARREEWQYGLFAEDGTFLGAFGLMTRRGRGLLEIGYWMHADALGRGHATEAVRALTDAGLQVDGVERMVIACDEANVRSAAIPKRLGYRLDRVDQRPPEAPGEIGRLQLWVRERGDGATTR
jgi:RimJ/RimL family protein N-acetyltransferase